MRYYIPTRTAPRAAGQIELFSVDYTRAMMMATFAGAATGSALGVALALSNRDRGELLPSAFGGLVFGAITGIAAAFTMKGSLDEDRRIATITA